MNRKDTQTVVRKASNTLRRADEQTEQLARLLIGRLRRVKSYEILISLKAELRGYDAKSKRWKGVGTH